MSVLAIIPARGGSKGLPRKNVLPLAGKPLIHWSIEAAKSCPSIDRIVVSTDDPEIAEVARNGGAEVPFLRPVELASDQSPSSEPILHAIETLSFHGTIVLLQPTSPLRTGADIAAALEVHRKSGGAPVVGVRMAKENPAWMFHLDEGNRLKRFSDSFPIAARRQDLRSIFVPNGALYVMDADAFRSEKTFYTSDIRAVVMPPERSIDIDTAADFEACAAFLKNP